MSYIKHETIKTLVFTICTQVCICKRRLGYIIIEILIEYLVNLINLDKSF